MSYNCYVDVVPFIVRSIWWDEFRDDPKTDLNTIIGNSDARGWVMTGNCEEFGKHENLMGQWIEKNGFKITIINESPYANGGAEDYTLCAEDKASIEAFLEDFKDCMVGDSPLEIEESDAVQQWL